MAKRKMVMNRRLFYGICIFIGVVAWNCVGAHSHSHDHGHAHDEPASFKYSREANEALKQKRAHDHGHSHDHGEHGHAHGGHGHAHDHGHGHGHAHGGHGHAHSEKDHGDGADFAERYLGATKESKSEKSQATLWLQALGATFLISVSPVFILLFIPLENTSEHQPLLKVLLSFASGGLLGDAFLHLIPHAVSPHSHGGEDGHGHTHSHGHSHGEGGGHDHDMTVGLWVLGGIIAFLIVEKTVRFLKGGHAHSHSHSSPKEAKKTSKQAEAEKKTEKKKAKTSDDEAEKDDEKEGKEEKEGKKVEEKKKEEKKETSIAKEVAPVEDIKVAGYLNLAADFAHNFTDGLAIGASFIVGRNVGIITTITIFLHEIPHEIGDFAILVQSGCTKRKAMMLQFSTAIGAMLGTVCSLLAEGAGDAAIAWILPFTAGGFIYIATVSVIPELLEDTKFGQSCKEIIALLLGVFMMVLIAKYE